MPSMSVNGVPITHHRNGVGPVVVVPECNVEWSAYHLQPLLERFTIVAVSPRGFMSSGRLASGGYSAKQITGDIERVLDHLEVGPYAAFGYSLNGAVASSLALGNPAGEGRGVWGIPDSRVVPEWLGADANS